MAKAATASNLEIYFLDMGLEKFGDCILCRRGSVTVLIDGGHRGDIRDRGGYPSIPKQLGEILNREPPFPISLLVLTHCHNDHIGCLPELIKENIIVPDWALVADENLGFGRASDQDNPLDAPDVPPVVARLVAALREEDHSSDSDAELAQFLADVAGLEDRYSEMLESIEQRIGNRLVRYGRDSTAALVRQFRSIGLEILGPTEAQLLECAEEIARQTRDAIDSLQDALADKQFGDADSLNEVAAYRALVSEQLGDSADADRPGFALNDQSIILRLNTAEANILLTGDMQFAEPQLESLVPRMATLRRKIAGRGPYDLAKIAHHGSHNAFDEDVLAELGDTPRYVISGGIRDAKHPHKDVLALLRQRRRQQEITWARTDKNGLITARFGRRDEFTGSRGRLNNTRPNVPDTALAVQLPATIAAPIPLSPVAAAATSPVVPPVGTTQKEEFVAGDRVRFFAEIPHETTKVTFTVDVQPARRPTGESRRDQLPSRLQLGAGRQLPPLLFVTCREGLERNIGKQETADVLQAVTAAGQTLIDSLPLGATDPRAVISAVREALNAKPEIQGVVLIGGYDIVPASRLDAIDANLRAQIRQAQALDLQIRDEDDFLVWSDALYGDNDGDDMGELPVSRIPDGRSPELVFRALQAGRNRLSRRAGIRNFARPYADAVYNTIRYTEEPKILVSEPASPEAAEYAAGYLNSAAVYLMLHGHYLHPDTFSGETPNRRTYPAINVRSVTRAKFDDAVVFSGCCWGALTVRERAIDGNPRTPPSPLAPEQSMALSLLNAGALAFIGCTGVHYSPGGTEPSYNGGPLHVGFWRHFADGAAPAAALFRAKTEYIRGIPHKPGADAFERAIELKILREFTCLGLGW